jgi:hypothetical protein
VGLKRGPLSLVSTIEELLECKSSGSCLESREYGRRDPSRWPRGTFYPQTLALTSLTSGGRSVGIVRSRTKATEFVFVFLFVCSREVPCASVLVKSGLENRDYCCTDHATTLYPQSLVLTSPTSCGRSVGIVRSQTKATELGS